MGRSALPPRAFGSLPFLACASLSPGDLPMPPALPLGQGSTLSPGILCSAVATPTPSLGGVAQIAGLSVEQGLCQVRSSLLKNACLGAAWQCRVHSTAAAFLHTCLPTQTYQGGTHGGPPVGPGHVHPRHPGGLQLVSHRGMSRAQHRAGCPPGLGGDRLNPQPSRPLA